MEKQAKTATKATVAPKATQDNSKLKELSKPANEAVNHTEEQPTPRAISPRKLPEKLSKSMVISLLHDAGFTVKEMVAANKELLEKKFIHDELVEGHCRNSVRDFTENPHKAANARLVAKAVGFKVPTKPTVVTLQPKPQPQVQQAAKQAETVKQESKK